MRLWSWSCIRAGRRSSRIQAASAAGSSAPKTGLSRIALTRIESICDCGDDNCASFATAATVKVASVVELQPVEGHLILDLNDAEEICFIEVLGRSDAKYLLEEHYPPPAP